MDFGTLFLDRELRIKRFTPRLTDLFNVTPGEGRPVTDFTHQLDYDGLAADAQRCSRPGPDRARGPQPQGRLVPGPDAPLSQLEDKIDGVVATFVDITERRQMQSDLRSANAKLEKRDGPGGAT